MLPFIRVLVKLCCAFLALGIADSRERERVSAATPSDEVRQGPRRLTPADHGVGRFVADCEFTDLAGQRHRLSDFREQKLLVVAMTSTSCPLSKKYLPTLIQLAETYASRQVGFLIVNPVSVDDSAAMQAAQASLKKNALYVPDGDSQLAAAVGAKSTTDVVVLKADRTIVYHGAIDDQYGLGYAREAPRRRLLNDALEALLAGLKPAVAATDAPGCALETPQSNDTANADSQPTNAWHNRVGRIVQQNCVECHRPGGVAPFSLETPEQVIAHGAMIRQVVERGVMPPWFAAHPPAGEASPWSNDRTLTHGDRKALLDWLQSDRPLGDAKDSAQPRSFPEGWLIGQPDVVFAFAQPVPVKATGVMPYQNVTIETELPEDRWVQAIEVRPGALEVVHHVVVSIVGSSDDDGARRDAGAEERAGFWALYVPGSSTLAYPAGYAKKLPRGARLRFQMHYTPNGTATEDTTRIGMIFATEPPKHEVRVAGIVNPRLKIPAGAANHREDAFLAIPQDVEVLAFLPHMHLRGKACRYDVIRRDGSEETLLDVPRYDFNWQLLYRYAEPKPLSQGDRLRFTAWFDNSDDNPANPDPAREVRWGPQTSDEMHLGYVEFIVPRREINPARSAPPRANRIILGLTIEALFERVDENRDNAISREEFLVAAQKAPKLKDRPEAQQALFQRLDADQNGSLTAAEFEKLLEIVRPQ